MEKILLGVIIIIFGGVCGYVLTKKYRKRKQFFDQFSKFNDRFLYEISYYRRPISELSSQYIYKGDFSFLLDLYFENIDNREVFTRSLFENSSFSFLRQEEKAVVEDYFSMLGKGDSVSQKACFSAQKERLGDLKNEADAMCKKYGDLYIKLGILCGLLVLILII